MVADQAVKLHPLPTHMHTYINRFAFLRGCGCVLSEKALKEVPSETCHKVSTKETSSMAYISLNCSDISVVLPSRVKMWPSSTVQMRM